MATLERHLDQIQADDETRAFCRDLAHDGVARIDLGESGRALCDRVAAEMDVRFAARKAGRIQDAWLRSAATRQLATHPKVKRLLCAAYDRPPFAFQTLNFRVGTEQPFHSDAIHFHSAPERFMCGVWTALEDISHDSGPLAYKPGSHRLPILTMRGAGVNHERPTYDDYCNLYLPTLQRTLESAALPTSTAVLPKGHALVWAANLVHGGAPIIDRGATRRSLVTHFFFKNCLYYTPMTSDVEDGRLSLRLPMNLSTGFLEWPRIDGKLARVGAKQMKDALTKIVLRRVHAE